MIATTPKNEAASPSSPPEDAEELLLERKEQVLDERRGQRSCHAYRVLRSAIAEAVTRQFLPLRFAW